MACLTFSVICRIGLLVPTQVNVLIFVFFFPTYPPLFFDWFLLSFLFLFAMYGMSLGRGREAPETGGALTVTFCRLIVGLQAGHWSWNGGGGTGWVLADWGGVDSSGGLPGPVSGPSTYFHCCPLTYRHGWSAVSYSVQEGARALDRSGD